MKKRESEFEKLARIFKEEIDDAKIEVREIKTELGGRMDVLEQKMDVLEQKMDVGFAGVNRRMDSFIQPQLDEHAHRIKKLEQKVFK